MASFSLTLTRSTHAVSGVRTLWYLMLITDFNDLGKLIILSGKRFQFPIATVNLPQCIVH